MLTVAFPHGLGDCVHFAHQLPLYARRGHRIAVACSPDKRILFAASGVELADDANGAPRVPWHEGCWPTGEARWDNAWRWSKAARNLSVAPMPDIGEPADLWDEYAAVRLNLWPRLPAEAHHAAKQWLTGLPRPVILLHTHGNTWPQRKNLETRQCIDLYLRLLERTEGTLVLLDWDDRAPRLAHARVRHLTDDWARIDTARLVSLLGRADLIVGVDSGPLHAARFTGTPAIGLWVRDGAPPTWSLPREQQVNIVSGKEHQRWSRRCRIPFRIVECADEARMPDTVASVAEAILTGPRYLHASEIGSDALLQWFVRERMRGGLSALGGLSDRHRSFDVLLREMSARFAAPRVVETGCIRAEDDFAGAGFSTYVFGYYLRQRGGRLTSIDHNAAHCAFARAWTACFGDTVEVVQADSVAWLREGAEPIDVLYLDSLDTESPNSAEHGLAEIEAAYRRLHVGSLVVFDDTILAAGAYFGKGALAVPWLLERGWTVAWSGHQTILCDGRRQPCRWGTP